MDSKKVLENVKKLVKKDVLSDPNDWPGSLFVFHQPKRPVKKNK